LQVERERGKDAEIDIFTSCIIESGKELSIPAPVYNGIYSQLKM
jgi:ketopantoate reductase